MFGKKQEGGYIYNTHQEVIEITEKFYCNLYKN